MFMLTCCNVLLLIFFTIPVFARRRNQSCLPLFDVNRSTFDLCQQRTCVLFTESSHFVHLGESRDSFPQLPFSCRLRQKTHPNLNGLFFDVLDQIPELKDSYCIYAKGCFHDDLVYILRDGADLGKYQFIAGGFLVDLQYLISNSSIPSSTIFTDHLAVYQKRLTAMESLSFVLSFTPWYITGALLIGLIYLRFILIWLYAKRPLKLYTLLLAESVEVEHHDPSDDNSQSKTDAVRHLIRSWLASIRISITLVLCIFILHYEIAVAYYIFRGPEDFSSFLKNRYGSRRIPENMKVFSFLRGSPEERFLRLSTPDFRSAARLQGNCFSYSCIIDSIQDPSHTARYGLMYESQSLIEFNRKGICHEFVASALLGEHKFVWYYSSSVLPTARNAVDSFLSRARTGAVLKSYGSGCVPSEPYVIHSTILTMLFYPIMILGLIIFLFIWIAKPRNFLQMRLELTILMVIFVILGKAEHYKTIFWLVVGICLVFPAFFRFFYGSYLSGEDCSRIRKSNTALVPQLTTSRTKISEHDKFVTFYTRINCEIDTKWPSFADNDSLQAMEEMPLSEYLKLDFHINVSFINHVDSAFWISEQCMNLDDDYWAVTSANEQIRRLTVQSRIGNSFLVIVDDFLIVFDESDKMFHARVPGSPCIKMSYASLMEHSGRVFDSLMGEKLTVQQVYLMIRRFVQFTGARWRFDCLAKIEQSLLHAVALRSPSTKMFTDIVIDMQPMSFDCLCGCSVGYVQVDESEFHNVAMHVFGETIGFRRTATGISSPELLVNVQLENFVEHTDAYNLAIGGDDHIIIHISPAEKCLKNTTYPVHPELVGVKLTKAKPHINKANSEGLAKIFCIEPDELKQGIIEDRPFYNLAYTPDTKKSEELMFKRYKLNELGKMKADFCQLRYGEALSYEIIDCVRTSCVWKNYSEGISMGEAQDLFLSKWDLLHNRTMMPFRIGPRKRRYLPAGEHFLLLNGTKLYIVRSTRKIMQSLATGLTGTFGVPSLFTISPSITYQASVSQDDLVLKSEVSSVYDTVQKIVGYNSEVTGFKSFSDGQGGIIPTSCGMKELLGSVVILCKLLQGRVSPKGRFKSAATSDSLPSMQEVDFDLPIPAGVVCSTFARLRRFEKYAMLAHRSWNKTKSNDYPMIIGINESDSELSKLMKK